jgi:hypothetical protein
MEHGACSTGDRVYWPKLANLSPLTSVVSDARMALGSLLCSEHDQH